MKTLRFWYPQQKDYAAALASTLLTPFSCFFKTGTRLRRVFAKPYRSRVPVICIGNVVVGGAGKTPTCLALAKILKKRGHKPCFVTRGYGGKGVSTCVDLALHSAEDVGDEALLLAAAAPTWAGRDRAAAARQAENYGSLILMDDGLQNPHITKTVSLLVVDGDVGIGNGRVIPAGPLRETFAEALKKIHAMIIIGENDRQNLTTRAKVPVFRARLQPDVPRGFPRDSRFVAFAGIARPEKFFATARSLALDLAEVCAFPDHYVFSEADIDALRLKAEEQGARLLTTEKDAARLPPSFRTEVIVLPVALVFDDAGAQDALARLIEERCG
ncbi:MAG: tetraacyldisaccharide 4'-kinase [Alphaproteobacteria bacterium]|nr:tetraacyldisaccharide 4'-kinase [Alphaproteobacteria bacterium]